MNKLKKINNLHDSKGERMKQILILSDLTGKITGKDTRYNCHFGKGKTHLAFMAFLKDSDDNFILTKRNKIKSLWGGYWDAAVVSHVLPNETPLDSVKRRCKEEIGIKADFKNIGEFYYYERFGEWSENEYCFVFEGKTKFEIEANPLEISSVKKISLPNLIKDYEKRSSKYTPWFKLAFEKYYLI